MSRSVAAPLVVLALVSTTLAGCVTLPGSDVENAAADLPFLPRVFDGFIHEYVDVPAPGGIGGVKVHLDLWRPDPATYSGADAAGKDAGVPVIVDMGPYFSSKSGPDRRVPHYVHEWIFEHMIPRGYAFAAVETPGTAGSTGCWDFMGPQETAAAAAAVDWLGDQAWSNGKVGMIGKSYDAMTQIMALSEHPERLATAVPVAPLTHAYGGIYMNAVPYTGFWGGAQASYQFLIGVAEPPAGTPERIPNYVERTPAQLACTPDNFANGVANLGDYNAYYAARDFRASAKDVTVPVFYMQGFLDENVHADNAFPYVNDLAGPKKVWLGQWYHDYANATWAGREDMYLTLHRWFDRWLKDVDNGVENDLGFEVQDSEGRWRREASWPPADAAPLAFRLADGELSRDAAATGAGTEFVDDAGARAVLPEAALPHPLPYGSARAWRSDGFASEAILTGPAVVSLNVSSSGPRGQVVAFLYDCPAGEADADCVLVTRGAMALTHRHGLERGEPLAPGETASVTFALQPRDYVFAAGRAAALVVAGGDGDFFVAEPTRNVITIHESAEAPSTLTLPVVERGADAFFLVSCGKRIAEKPCYRADLRDRYPPGAGEA